jgi:hypothetical protein
MNSLFSRKILNHFELTMIKQMFGFVTRMGDFIPQGITIEITSCRLHHPILFAGSGKQSVCRFFFAWLLLVDRLNTRDMLRRRHKHLEEGYSCVLCSDQVDETSIHLFF